jgi:hypothetical protein
MGANMTMSPVILNDPLDLPWQTNLFDAVMVAIFIASCVNAVVRFRRGTRIYAFVLVSALVYGVVLELAGMATLNMYVQGKFAVMLNFPAIPLFAGTTEMPLYVTLFYPVIFTVAFKVVDALGVVKRWQAAVTGGLFMVVLDAPYIIEGNLRHVVWWTWSSDFKMFQYWLGWPLVDMFWQATWGATFLYLMLRARPHVDGMSEPRWRNGIALAVRAPLAAVAVLFIGTVLMLPLVGVTISFGRQWPVLVVLVAGMAAVAVSALRTAKPPTNRVDPLTGWMTGIYVVAFLAMVIGNVVFEGRITAYLAVQSLGLLGVVAFATFPMWASRRHASSAPTASTSAQRDAVDMS